MSFNPSLVIAISIFLVAIVTVSISVNRRNNRLKRNRRYQHQQSLLPTTNNAVQQAQDRRIKQLVRSNGPLGWNAQRFPDRINAPLPAAPTTPMAPPRAHVRQGRSDEADPPPPYVA